MSRNSPFGMWEMTIIEGLKTLLEYFRDERHRREDRADEVLLAIYTAVNETKLYIQDVQRTGKSKPEREADLSRLWTRAAVPIRRFNEDLADRCLMKGEYWVNPSAWTVERIAQFRIGLDDVFKEAKKLLKQ